MVRRRVTIMVERDRSILLVREKGADKHSLPGGGMEKILWTDEEWGHKGAMENLASEARRELFEETGMVAGKMEYLFQHVTRHTDHRVFFTNSLSGEPVSDRKELHSCRWWDGKSTLSLRRSTRDILLKWNEKRLFSRFPERYLTANFQRESSAASKGDWESVHEIPAWIDKVIGGIYKKYGTSSLGEMSFRVNGRSFQYRIDFAGQGGTHYFVFRRPRGN